MKNTRRVHWADCRRPAVGFALVLGVAARHLGDASQPACHGEVAEPAARAIADRFRPARRISQLQPVVWRESRGLRRTHLGGGQCPHRAEVRRRLLHRRRTTAGKRQGAAGAVEGAANSRDAIRAHFLPLRFERDSSDRRRFREAQAVVHLSTHVHRQLHGRAAVTPVRNSAGHRVQRLRGVGGEELGTSTALRKSRSGRRRRLPAACQPHRDHFRRAAGRTRGPRRGKRAHRGLSQLHRSGDVRSGCVFT